MIGTHAKSMQSVVTAMFGIIKEFPTAFMFLAIFFCEKEEQRSIPFFIVFFFVLCFCYFVATHTFNSPNIIANVPSKIEMNYHGKKFAETTVDDAKPFCCFENGILQC